MLDSESYRNGQTLSALVADWLQSMPRSHNVAGLTPAGDLCCTLHSCFPSASSLTTIQESAKKKKSRRGVGGGVSKLIPPSDEQF